MKNTRKNLFQLPIHLIGIALFLVLGLTNCTSKQQVIQKANSTNILKEATPANTLITYSKVRGRGNRRPLYTIEILDSKKVKYTGIANVPNIGEEIKALSEKKYKKIVQQFEAADFKAFKESYKTKMRDLPLSRIAFEGHTITYQEAACPSELRILTDLIEGLVVHKNPQKTTR